MIVYKDSPEVESYIAQHTHIDGFKMVDDLYTLSGLVKLDLPLEINRDWHPKIKEMYNRRISGEQVPEIPARISRSIYDLDFYVYEVPPIDDWSGYNLLFLEDLICDTKWLNLIHHSFKILRFSSNWEEDVREGPFISMLPGNEIPFAHWVVLVKQDNNGNTYIVSRYSLDYLNDYLVKCNIVEKGW